MQQICYDTTLSLEAYHLNGTTQAFPEHFHEEYVFGFIASGHRQLHCKGRMTILQPGDMVIFNPYDDHGCVPLDDTPFDYYALNVSPMQLQTMWDTPYFAENVLSASLAAEALYRLCQTIFRQAAAEEKIIAWQTFLQSLANEASLPPQKPSAPIAQLCRYMETHFAENLTLDDLLAIAKCSKSNLLRTFTKQVGVSPYRYLQTVRLNQARKWLAQGMSVAQAAQQAGFADQSHFTRAFKNFTGLTPKRYQRIHTKKGE